MATLREAGRRVRRGEVGLGDVAAGLSLLGCALVVACLSVPATAGAARAVLGVLGVGLGVLGFALGAVARSRTRGRRTDPQWPPATVGLLAGLLPTAAIAIALAVFFATYTPR